MENKLIGALKKITNKPKQIMALPLDTDDLKKGLDTLFKNEDFKKMKKEFFKIRNDLANKIDLNEDHANSLMTYALHYDRLK